LTLRVVLSRTLNGYSALTVLIVTISLVAAGLAIGFRMNRNTERKFCDIAESNAIIYEETPPTTKTGIQLAENWHSLRERLHCPPGKE
jgi:hypothetical protein